MAAVVRPKQGINNPGIVRVRLVDPAGTVVPISNLYSEVRERPFDLTKPSETWPPVIGTITWTGPDDDGWWDGLIDNALSGQLEVDKPYHSDVLFLRSDTDQTDRDFPFTILSKPLVSL